MKFFTYTIILLISCGYHTKAALVDLDEGFIPPNAVAQVGIQCDDATYFFDCLLPKWGYLENRDKVFIVMPFTHTEEIPYLVPSISGTLASLTNTDTDDGKRQIFNQVSFVINPPLPKIPTSVLESLVQGG